MILVGCLSWASLCTIPTWSRGRILVVTWTTFGKVAGWESLASKVQARGADVDLVEIGKPMSWFTDYSC